MTTELTKKIIESINEARETFLIRQMTKLGYLAEGDTYETISGEKKELIMQKFTIVDIREGLTQEQLAQLGLDAVNIASADKIEHDGQTEAIIVVKAKPDGSIITANPRMAIAMQYYERPTPQQMLYKHERILAEINRILLSERVLAGEELLETIEGEKAERIKTEWNIIPQDNSETITALYRNTHLFATIVVAADYESVDPFAYKITTTLDSETVQNDKKLIIN